MGIDIPVPDAHSCTKQYGHPPLSACEAALNNLPYGELPSIFTSRTSEPTNNYITVPQYYVDSAHPLCAITIDLDGHSTRDVFISVPWNTIRNITTGIIDRCIARINIGGWETFGLKRAFDAVISPSFIGSEDGGSTAAVADPDGTITSVAVPEDSSQKPPSLGT